MKRVGNGHNVVGNPDMRRSWRAWVVGITGCPLAESTLHHLKCLRLRWVAKLWLLLIQNSKNGGG